MATSPETLNFLDQQLRKEFEANRRVLSFEEYLNLVAEKPGPQMRGSAAYVLDMIDHYGKTPLKPAAAAAAGVTSGQAPLYRFNLFDHSPDPQTRRVVGQEQVQNQLYRSIKTFARQGMNNKLILLHGPNGSAKSSIIHAIMGGLERYSHEPDGAIYSFNWVFPVDKIVKGGIGLGNYSPSAKETHASYARLPDDEVLARIPCEMKDHPILMVPQDRRREFLEKLIGKEKCDGLWDTLPTYITRGNLCHRCKQVFDALLIANQGDFKKVVMHVQVERFYHSRRYREGLVTVEPQMHVDAHYQQLTYNRSMGTLPASLASLNLFSLSGDLVEGNRGIVEYSDLLKRPIDTFKYLLIACETGSVNVGSSIAFLDTLMLGSTNELQLDAFKEFPDFTSFKARIELIRVPYLLSTTEEQEIYRADIEQIAHDKHVAPHAAWALSLWAVLSRLKKPNSINYPPNVSSIISNLSPLEKAKLYDTLEMPHALAAEDRKLLRSSVRRLREEYLNIPYYEGRMGASARELRSLLYDASQNAEFACLSPLAVLREMEEFVKRVSEYEFLKQDVKDGYHDAQEFINIVREEYLGKIDHEVRDSMGLYESAQWEDFLKKYVLHVSLAIKKEKIKNPVTGALEDPDFALISEFEKIVSAPEDGAGRDTFRQNIISQVGAWSLDHTGEPVVYAKVFPEFWAQLEKHYYESQKSLLTKMYNALLLYDNPGRQAAVTEEGSKLAEQTVSNLKKRLGYCDHCAKEVITFLMRKRYYPSA